MSIFKFPNLSGRINLGVSQEGFHDLRTLRNYLHLGRGRLTGTEVPEGTAHGRPRPRGVNGPKQAPDSLTFS